MSRDIEIAQLKTTLSLDAGDFKKQLTSASKETTNLKKSFDIANRSIENAEDSMQATTNAIQKGESAMDSMNKKLELQKKRYDDLKSTVDRQTKQYSDLTQELSKAEQELEQLEKAENKNTEAIEKQKQAIDDLKKKLNDKAQLIDKNINNLQKYSNDIDKTENDVRGLGNQLGNLKSSLEGTAEATESVSEASEKNKLGDFKDLANEAGVNLDFLELSAMGAALALAVVVTKAVIDAAGNYDKAITDLQITMGITEQSAKDLYDAIQDISEGGYSIEGISEAVKMLEQRFGLSAQQSEELAQGIDLLNKYGYESKDVIRFMTTAVNDWGMTYEQALDYILAGQQAGLNMSEDWMDTLVEYAPIFSTLGVSGNDAFNLIRTAMQATGVDSDKAADMVKEFFLTLTDGSTTSEDAFASLGLNIDTLKNQINDGSITSVEAMQKVMQAIMGVGDETEQARLLQEIFKGTVEYGSVGVVDAWANMQNQVVDTAGTVEQAKIAFEGSYEASKQDLSNSWNELTTTIGGGVIPALNWVVELLNVILRAFTNLGPMMKNQLDTAGNDIAQWTLGAIGKFQEFEISVIEGAIKIAEALGKDEWSEKWKGSLEGVKQKHSETTKQIIQNEKDRQTIDREGDQIRSEVLRNGAKNYDDYANSEIEADNRRKKSNSETNQNLRTETESSAKTVAEKSNQIGQDMKKGMDQAKTSAEQAMSGVKGAVDTNMQGSLARVQQDATNMYLGVKTSFYKMNESARQDGTAMYLGVKTSAEKMASSAKSAATDMYNGVTTSTSRMAQKAIADWNSVRSAYSKGITGSVTLTTHKKTVVHTPEQQDIEYKSISALSISGLDIEVPNISPYVTSGAYFTPSTSSNYMNNDNNNINNALIDLLNKLDNKINNKKDNQISLNIENFNNNKTQDLEQLVHEIAFYMKRKDLV